MEPGSHPMSPPMQPTLPSFWGTQVQAPPGIMPWSTVQYPGMPHPGAYMPTPQMPQMPYMPQMPMPPDLRGRSYTSSPAATGFAGSHGANVFSRILGQGLIASPLDQALANFLGGPGAGITPVLGVSDGMSRYGASMAMVRQKEGQLIARDLAQTNPALTAMFGQVPGMGGSAIGKAGIGALDQFFGNMGGGFNTILGTLGHTFGGDLRSQASAAGALTTSVAMGLTDRRTGGWDFGATHGMQFDDVASSLARAGRMNIFGISDKMLREEAIESSSGDRSRIEASSERLARTASALADVTMAGRDVFGRDASMEDIAGGIESIFGASALKDPSKAAGLLRDLDSASQVLDLDSESLSKYLVMMKKVAENAGIASSSSSTSAGMSMISNVEGLVRKTGRETGVQLDRNKVAEMVATTTGNYAGSEFSNLTTVVQNVLDGTSEEELLRETVEVNGVQITKAQARDYLSSAAKVIADTSSTKEEVSEAQRRYSSVVTAMQGDEKVLYRMRYFDENRESEEARLRIRAGEDVLTAQVETGTFSAPARRFERYTDDQQKRAAQEMMDRGILQALAVGQTSTAVDEMEKWAQELGMNEDETRVFISKLMDTASIVDTEGTRNLQKGAADALLALGGGRMGEEVANEIEAGSTSREMTSQVYGRAMSFDMAGLSKAASAVNEILKSGGGIEGVREHLRRMSSEDGIVANLALSSNEELMQQMMSELQGVESEEEADEIKARYLKSAVEDVLNDGSGGGGGGALESLIKKAKSLSSAGEGTDSTSEEEEPDQDYDKDKSAVGVASAAGALADLGGLSEIFTKIERHLSLISGKIQEKLP